MQEREAAGVLRDTAAIRTPFYVVDETLLKKNLEILKDTAERAGCRILLAQKAFSMYSVYPLIRQYLMEELQIPDYRADICAAFSQGNVGKAKRLALSDSFGEMLEHALHMVKYISEMEPSDLVEDLKKINTYKMDIQDYLDLLTVWYRDVLMFKATCDANNLVFSNELNSIRDKAKDSSYEGLECIIKALEKAKVRLNANVNFDMAMELLLLTMKEN